MNLYQPTFFIFNPSKRKVFSNNFQGIGFKRIPKRTGRWIKLETDFTLICLHVILCQTFLLLGYNAGLTPTEYREQFLN